MTFSPPQPAFSASPQPGAPPPPVGGAGPRGERQRPASAGASAGDGRKRWLSAVVDEHWLDFALGHISPLFSVSRTKARVTSITRETHDTVGIGLLPNRHFRGHRPGQFLPIRVAIGGVIHERCYSITSEPFARELRVAVKRQPGGLVSNWLHDALRAGDVLELGAASGEFCLPESLTLSDESGHGRGPRLLFIAGGSGITPIYSLVRAALGARPGADVVVAYYARSRADFIFGAELFDLAKKSPGLRLHFFVDDDAPPGGAALPEPRALPACGVGRFSAEHVAAYAPDVAEREAFLCGPFGLMQAVSAFYDSAGLRDRLHAESFGPPKAPPRPSGGREAIVFARTGLSVLSSAPTLLEAAEGAGLRPAFGCRRGICNTCACKKLSGAVRNRVTGAVDDAPGSTIRLCVSEPLSAVSVDL